MNDQVMPYILFYVLLILRGDCYACKIVSRSTSDVLEGRTSNNAVNNIEPR